MAGEAGGEAKAIAIIKNGATSGWEETAPKETTHHVAKSLYRDVSNEYSLAHAQQPVSTHRLKLFFGQTFMFLETVASMPTQAARRVKRAPVEEKHFAAPGLLARVMARLRGLSRFSLTGRRGAPPLGRLLSSQEFRMHGVEVFRLLQDFLVAEQPFLLAKLNPQLLKGSKYSTESCVLGPLYGSGTFSRHRPDIYRHSTLSLHRWVLQRRPLVAAPDQPIGRGRDQRSRHRGCVGKCRAGRHAIGPGDTALSRIDCPAHRYVRYALFGKTVIYEGQSHNLAGGHDG